MPKPNIPPIPFEIINNSIRTPTHGMEIATFEVQLLHRITQQLDELIEQNANGETLNSSSLPEAVDTGKGEPEPETIDPPELPQIIKTVDLNTATKTDLIALETIGRASATTIIKNRPFKDLADAQEKMPDLEWDKLGSLVSFN